MTTTSRVSRTPSTPIVTDGPSHDAAPIGRSSPTDSAGVAPPLRMPYLVSGRGQQDARQMIKALPVLQAQWSQELHDARRAGRTVGYFQQRKQDLRRAIDLEIDHGNRGETPLSAAYRLLIDEVNRILAGMPHAPNKVEGKRLRQLCRQYGEKPEVLMKRPDILALLQQSTEAASARKPHRERRLKGPRVDRPGDARERHRSSLMRHGLDA